MNTPRTVMVVVNSVCGCAAGKARPGVALALLSSRGAVHPGSAEAGLVRLSVRRERAGWLRRCSRSGDRWTGRRGMARLPVETTAPPGGSYEELRKNLT